MLTAPVPERFRPDSIEALHATGTMLFLQFQGEACLSCNHSASSTLASVPSNPLEVPLVPCHLPQVNTLADPSHLLQYNIGYFSICSHTAKHPCLLLVAVEPRQLGGQPQALACLPSTLGPAMLSQPFPFSI